MHLNTKRITLRALALAAGLLFAAGSQANTIAPPPGTAASGATGNGTPPQTLTITIPTPNTPSDSTQSKTPKESSSHDKNH